MGSNPVLEDGNVFMRAEGAGAVERRGGRESVPDRSSSPGKSPWWVRAWRVLGNEPCIRK